MDQNISIYAKVEEQFIKFSEKFSKFDRNSKLILGIVGLIINPFVAFTFLITKNIKAALIAALLGACIIVCSPILFIDSFLLIPFKIVFGLSSVAYFGIWVYGVIDLIKFFDNNPKPIESPYID